MGQTISGTVIHGGVVPPYSSTTIASVEFIVSHSHMESGNSFGGLVPLNVETAAQGGDNWEVDDWEDATVTVDFLLDAKIQSSTSLHLINIQFQSTYFGFALAGTVNFGTSDLLLELRDGDGDVLSTRPFVGSTGLDVAHLNFTVPAVPQFGAAYISQINSTLIGLNTEEPQAFTELQTIDWHVGFTLN